MTSLRSQVLSFGITFDTFTLYKYSPNSYFTLARKKPLLSTMPTLNKKLPLVTLHMFRQCDISLGSSVIFI